MSEKIEKAMNLFGEKKYKEAIDAFSSVLETEPDNADVYNNMGVAYSCEGDFEHAEKSYQPRLIQGIRRRDGIGEGQETTA